MDAKLIFYVSKKEQQNHHSVNVYSGIHTVSTSCLFPFTIKRSTLTDAHVGLQDHADIVGAVSDGQRDGMLFGRFNHFHYLKSRDVHEKAWIPETTRPLRSYLSFLKRRHSTAEHGAAVTTDFQEDLFVTPRVGVLLGGPHDCREGGSIDDQPVVGAVTRQAAEEGRAFSGRWSGGGGALQSTGPPGAVVPRHAPRGPEDHPAQFEQDIVEVLLLHPFGGQLQDVGAAAKQLAGVAGGGRRLHLVSGQNPHLHSRFVERLDGVCRFVLQSGNQDRTQ